jgi:C-terminal processing protease CtpA/Prc
VSARGSQIEGNGVTPDVSIPWSFEDAERGVDAQLEGAIDILRVA